MYARCPARSFARRIFLSEEVPIIVVVVSLQKSVVSNHREQIYCNMSTEPALVSTDWVSKEMLSGNKNHLSIIDASWGGNADPLQDYKQQHLPGAHYFDITKCKAPGGELNLMFTMPTAEFFAEYVGSLGIDNDRHVIVYENNAAMGYFSSPRVWWMFRVFGHAKVSVMDGGLPQWVKEGRETTADVSPVTKATFTASFKPELFKSFSDIEENLKEKKYQVMDARPPGRFNGTDPEPRKDCVSGHMPNSVNIPFPMLMEDRDGFKRYKPADQLRETFAGRGADLSRPVIASCWPGVTACVLVLGAFLAGKEDVAVFGGSWEEYSLRMVKINPQNIVKSE